MRVGAHLGISRGFDCAVAEALSLSCQALQVFSGNPRGWRRKTVDPDEAARFRRLCADRDLKPVVVHTPYLINLAAPDPAIFRKSLKAFAADLARSRLLGADWFVTHMGYHRGGGTEEGVRRMAAALAELLSDYPFAGPKVLLENTATAGSSLGHSFSVIGRVMAASGVADRLFLCLDTCHAFVAGYDIASAWGLSRALKEIDEHIGLKKLKLVHFNDSKFPRGSGLDRHQHLGRGAIGAVGLKRIARHRLLRDLVFIIETPKDSPQADRHNLEFLRSLAMISPNGHRGRLKARSNPAV